MRISLPYLFANSGTGLPDLLLKTPPYMLAYTIGGHLYLSVRPPRSAVTHVALPAALKPVSSPYEISHVRREDVGLQRPRILPTSHLARREPRLRRTPWKTSRARDFEIDMSGV